MTQNHNVCILCGKVRIISSRHTEKVGGCTLTYTNTICPDPECQRKVDRMLKKEKDKRDEIKTDFEKRAKERIKASRQNKFGGRKPKFQKTI